MGTLTEFEAVTLGDAAEDLVIAGAPLLTRLPRGQIPFDVYRIVMKFEQKSPAEHALDDENFEG